MLVVEALNRLDDRLDQIPEPTAPGHHVEEHAEAGAAEAERVDEDERLVGGVGVQVDVAAGEPNRIRKRWRVGL